MLSFLIKKREAGHFSFFSRILFCDHKPCDPLAVTVTTDHEAAVQASCGTDATVPPQFVAIDDGVPG